MQLTDAAAKLSARLAYNRERVTPGIVHLGIGAFSRAHLAVFVDDVLRNDPSWGIIGASLKRPDVRDALATQNFLYTLAVQSGTGSTFRVIGAVIDILYAARQKKQLLAAMSHAGTRIVSLTVTEKGYCHEPSTGELSIEHPDIRHDLMQPEAPLSVPGLIVRALELRRIAGIPPFTVLCCDNLPSNGETTARVVSTFATMRSSDLGRFVSKEVSFPSTMVDRIVPATTEDDRRFVRDATGVGDAWPVMTEPFSQWVIEDRFTAGRPAFETVGAQLVSDVRPFEIMKLRMLNGSHSTLAYLGYLAGYEFVSDAIAQPHFRKLIHDLMSHEIGETLNRPHSELTAYRDAVLARFANPALKHRTWQIAMDGSQKLPQRLLGTIRDRLTESRPVTLTSLGVAGWMVYVTGWDEEGRTIDVRDPLAERLHAVAKAAGNSPENLVDGMLGVTEIFGKDLPQNDVFRATLIKLLSLILRKGVTQSLLTLATNDWQLPHDLRA